MPCRSTAPASKCRMQAWKGNLGNSPTGPKSPPGSTGVGPRRGPSQARQGCSICQHLCGPGLVTGRPERLQHWLVHMRARIECGPCQAGTKHLAACTRPGAGNGAGSGNSGDSPAGLQLPLLSARTGAVSRPSQARLQHPSAYMWAGCGSRTNRAIL